MDISKKTKIYVGIDEAGRGPLAGPVFVAAVAAKERVFLTPFYRSGIKDSKMLSPQERERVFKHIQDLKKKGVISYVYSFVGPKSIDRDGISKAVYLGVRRCLRKLDLIHDTAHVLLDGALCAPRTYPNQETIIRGDEKEILIALASIVAKVKRDKKMESMEAKYPGYSLAQHKGYGTKLHFEALKAKGASDFHRRSFIKNLSNKRGKK